MSRKSKQPQTRSYREGIKETCRVSSFCKINEAQRKERAFGFCYAVVTKDQDRHVYGCDVLVISDSSLNR